MLSLVHPTSAIKGDIQITGSKSESNRWLILQQIFKEQITLKNLSKSQDTQVLERALVDFNHFDFSLGKHLEINVGHTGTAMRFLTAYFAAQPTAKILLTGSHRMQQRPIEPLVTALHDLGCEIAYVAKQGYPPIQISGTPIKQHEVSIKANVSSQYITALLLMAAGLPKGLKIHLLGEITSRPYIEMTLKQLSALGANVEWLENVIETKPIHSIISQQINIESDWSSASYWFSIAALSQTTQLALNSYTIDSMQGDAVLQDIYAKYFGVHSEIKNQVLYISKIDKFELPEFLELDLNNTPDIAQTIAVTCAGLKIKAKLTGLHTLKVKETDRLEALTKELYKCGVASRITQNAIELISFNHKNETPEIETYQDHRMAMAFAPLALKMPIMIKNQEVVNKSYPTFWTDLEAVGFKIT